MILCNYKFDERFAASELRPGTVAPLVFPDQELGLGHSRAADRSGLMRRIEDCLMVQTWNFVQLLPQRPSDLALAFQVEIRLPDITYEQVVSGKHPDRSILVLGIVKHEGEVIFGMTGGLQNLYDQIAHSKPVAIASSLGIDTLPAEFGPW